MSATGTYTPSIWHDELPAWSFVMSLRGGSSVQPLAVVRGTGAGCCGGAGSRGGETAWLGFLMGLPQLRQNFWSSVAGAPQFVQNIALTQCGGARTSTGSQRGPDRSSSQDSC